MAQVAEQQGKYLAKCLNDEARGHKGPCKPFVYHHLGSMASLGMPLEISDSCLRRLPSDDVTRSLPALFVSQAASQQS